MNAKLCLFVSLFLTYSTTWCSSEKTEQRVNDQTIQQTTISSQPSFLQRYAPLAMLSGAMASAYLISKLVRNGAHNANQVEEDNFNTRTMAAIVASSIMYWCCIQTLVNRLQGARTQQT